MTSKDKQLFDALASAVQAYREAQSAYLDAHHAYCRHRLEVIAQGGEPEDLGPLPVAPQPVTPPDQHRREQLARERYETDRAVRRDPSTSSRFGG